MTSSVTLSVWRLASRRLPVRFSEIFTTFVRDELRHSHVAQMLADHYDVHRYKIYEQDPNMRAFTRAFAQAIQFFSPEIASVYITAGEMLLDIALLEGFVALARHLLVPLRYLDHAFSPMNGRRLEPVQSDAVRGPVKRP